MAVTLLFSKIRAQLQEQGIQPREVRLMRNKSSGESLSIAPMFFVFFLVLYSPVVILCYVHPLPSFSCSFLFLGTLSYLLGFLPLINKFLLLLSYYH